MIEDAVFNNHVENFKKLSYIRKKEESIKELKKLFGLVSLLNEKYGLPKNVLYNREILDVNARVMTDDDYAEAVFVYAHIIQEGIAEYIDKTCDKLEVK